MNLADVGRPKIFNARARDGRDHRRRRAGAEEPLVAWADCPHGRTRALLVSRAGDVERDVAELRRRLGYVTGETIRLHVAGGGDARDKLTNIDHLDLVE